MSANETNQNFRYYVAANYASKKLGITGDVGQYITTPLSLNTTDGINATNTFFVNQLNKEFNTDDMTVVLLNWMSLYE
jgi:hypothetical protein